MKNFKIKHQIRNINSISSHRNYILYIVYWVLNIVFVSHVFILSATAALRSTNYVIYENVNYSFDGPVISGVASSVSEATATVSWTTDIVADGFVIYDTENTFLASREQGVSAKTLTNHSVALSGLDENTRYYYKVKSSGVNNGITIDSTVREFTTGAVPVEEVAETPQGGGMLIIDKTDKVAPKITDLDSKITSSTTIEVSWTTDEDASGFVEYGLSNELGRVSGSWKSVKEHVVNIDSLEHGQTYYFRAASSDSWGNLSYSEISSITMPPLTPEEIKKLEEEKEAKTDDAAILAVATKKAMEFILKLFPEVSLNDMSKNPITDIKSLADITSFIPAPILAGEPKMEFTAKEAKFIWTTDVESNSLVAISPEDRYKPNAVEPYIQVSGNAEDKTKNHEVRIFNLSPNTTYHYQLRSKSGIGPVARSRDFTFKTKTEEIVISNFYSQIENRQTAVFKWVTNKDADAAVKIIPFRNNQPALDQAKIFKDNKRGVIHEIKVADFVEGVFYDIELESADDKGNIARQKIDKFATAEDDLPPEISQIKTDSVVFTDKSGKTQTIISWQTNEPTISRIYYDEGVRAADAQLNGKTEQIDDYKKEHVSVITKFKPGTVYSFKIEVTDSRGNVTVSKTHTFMTAKQKESIIQIIINILGNSFGWLTKMIK